MFDSAVILVAEADDRLRQFVTDQLTADRAQVLVASDDTQLRARLVASRPDALVVGDLGLGVAVENVRSLRGAIGLPSEPAPDVPILALVEQRDELAVLRAFDADVDDVADRSVPYAILRARLRVLLGLAGRRTAATTLRVGSLELCPATRQAWLRGDAIELSGKEHALLAVLASDPTRVFTRDELLREVWGFRCATRTRTLDTHAHRLRRKLGAHGDDFVVNVWGVGYRLSARSARDLATAA